MIINSGDEKNPEMNYKTHLDLVTDDLKNIKTKLSSLESKVKTIRKEYLNEVVSFFLILINQTRTGLSTSSAKIKILYFFYTKKIEGRTLIVSL